MTKEKIVLLNSGGVDSRVVAKMLSLDETVELHSLFIFLPNLPSSNNQLIAAKETADNYCTSHEIITLDAPFTGLLFDPLAQKYIDPATLSEADKERLQGERQTPAPSFKLIAHSLGISYARSIGATTLVSGYLTVGEKWCMDFSEFAIDSITVEGRMNPKVGRQHYVKVKGPLSGMNTTAVPASLTDKEYATTVSCSQVEPCGHCNSCKRRQRYENSKMNRGISYG